jgi:hypothetical protein
MGDGPEAFPCAIPRIERQQQTAAAIRRLSA